MSKYLGKNFKTGEWVCPSCDKEVKALNTVDDSEFGWLCDECLEKHKQNANS
jgi:hypothetical protein